MYVVLYLLLWLKFVHYCRVILTSFVAFFELNISNKLQSELQLLMAQHPISSFPQIPIDLADSSSTIQPGTELYKNIGFHICVSHYYHKKYTLTKEHEHIVMTICEPTFLLLSDNIGNIAFKLGYYHRRGHRGLTQNMTNACKYYNISHTYGKVSTYSLFNV